MKELFLLVALSLNEQYQVTVLESLEANTCSEDADAKTMLEEYQKAVLEAVGK